MDDYDDLISKTFGTPDERGEHYIQCFTAMLAFLEDTPDDDGTTLMLITVLHFMLDSTARRIARKR